MELIGPRRIDNRPDPFENWTDEDFRDNAGEGD